MILPDHSTNLSRLTFAGTLTFSDVAVLTSASRKPLLLVELVLAESVVMTEASSPAIEETCGGMHEGWIVTLDD